MALAGIADAMQSSAMGHGHSHHSHDSENGHSHACPSQSASQQRLGIAALITGAFMMAEVFGGWISGSLALLADAGHMTTDFLALSAAWLAFKLSGSSSNDGQPNRWGNLPNITAFVSSCSLILIAAIIIWEGVLRISNPGEVLAGPMLAIAVLGLIVNLVVFRILTRGDQSNLNMKAASLHVLGDLLGSVAAIIAAILILTMGWILADPILSIVVAIFITVFAIPTIIRSAKTLRADD